MILPADKNAHLFHPHTLEWHNLDELKTSVSIFKSIADSMPCLNGCQVVDAGDLVNINDNSVSLIQDNCYVIVYMQWIIQVKIVGLLPQHLYYLVTLLSFHIYVYIHKLND